MKPKWNLTLNYAVAACIHMGLEKLPGLYGLSEIDDERIVDYVAYQLYRCRKSIADGKWKITWLFSEQSMDRFRRQFMSETGKSGMNYYIDQWLYEAELSRHDLIRIIADEKPSPLRDMVYMPSEEPVKRRFHNTADGFTLCQCSTTGWSPLSEACRECSFWADCGKQTAARFPELLRFRKEAYVKQKK